MLTRIAGVELTKIFGGSAFTPGVFLGLMALTSIDAITRSRAMTRSWSGIELSIALTIALESSGFIVEKAESVIWKSLKLTRRSCVDTLVFASILIVPIVAVDAPFGV